MTVKEVSGFCMDVVMEKRKFLAGKGWGCARFVSHEKYRQFAKDHGDILKLEVVVTLHTKAEGDGWTR